MAWDAKALTVNQDDQIIHQFFSSSAKNIDKANRYCKYGMHVRIRESKTSASLQCGILVDGLVAKAYQKEIRSLLVVRQVTREIKKGHRRDVPHGLFEVLP